MQKMSSKIGGGDLPTMVVHDKSSKTADHGREAVIFDPVWG